MCAVATVEKSANVLIGDTDKEHQGMIIMLLLFQLVIYQIGGLTPGPIYMCVLIFLCFVLTRSQGLDPYCWGNGSIVAVHGVGTVNLKFASANTVRPRNIQHAPPINKNLVSGSILCANGFKLVFI